MTTRDEFIAGLRELATFLETHPAVPLPKHNVLYVFTDNRAEIAQIARLATWAKEYNGHYFHLTKTFGDHLALSITAHRETVCKRVVTGTQTVPAQPERTVETVAWVCEDASLLAGAAHE